MADQPILVVAVAPVVGLRLSPRKELGMDVGRSLRSGRVDGGGKEYKLYWV